jgi:hypothetical protein
LSQPAKRECSAETAGAVDVGIQRLGPYAQTVGHVTQRNTLDPTCPFQLGDGSVDHLLAVDADRCCHHTSLHGVGGMADMATPAAFGRPFVRS